MMYLIFTLNVKQVEKYHVFFVGRRRSYVRDVDPDPDFNEARR